MHIRTINLVLLIRHLESEKNVKNCFSSNLDNEKLTEFGEDEGKKLADNIYYYVKKNHKKSTDRFFSIFNRNTDILCGI